MKSRANSWAVLLVFATGTACGGKSASEASSQSADGGSTAHEGGAGNLAGGAANGGTANGGTANGGASANPSGGGAQVSTECPIVEPATGSVCDASDMHCSYAVDACNTTLLVCTNGVWLEQPGNDGAALTCFNFNADQLGIPKDGDSCACRGMLDCTFDECDTQGVVHAKCDNTTWHVTSTPCTDTPCGDDGLHCSAGQTCVIHSDSPIGSYACVPNPCTEQAETLSCDCAGSLCSSPSERCTIYNGQVECVCDTC